MTRLPKSVLVGFQDAGPLGSWYAYTLPYNTNDPFTATISQVLTAIGLPKFDGPSTLDLSEDPAALKEEGLLPGSYVVLHPRGSADKRSFTEEEAVSLINALLAADSSLRVVLTGSKADADFTHAIQAKVASAIRVSTILGGSPAKLAAILKHARFFMGVDTGTTHVACFLGARVIVVAHNATANWLPYYHPNARVLYRLEEDTVVHEELSYLNAHRRGRIKPFGRVPSDQLISGILEELRA
jgi:ADP-heptose:LPS heptosyltransferase